MLNSEQAAERLDTFKIPGWLTKRTTALGKLPAPFAKAAVGMFAPERSDRNGQQQREREKALAGHLADLSPAKRVSFFENLFPKLAIVLDRAWVDIAKGTYTTGFACKPFRAPNSSELVNRKRAEWLAGVVIALRNFDPDAEWLAAWAPHIGGWTGDLGSVLAAAIDLGGKQGDAVLEVLRQSASGTHEIGCMGRHIPRALLGCSRPEAWEFMERMLLAAQREEGLRQSILETVHESHPEAFRRFLRLIVDEKLIRFSATIRAVDVWFGLHYDAMSSKQAESIVRKALEFFDDPRARKAALVDGDGESAYVALWTEAFNDVDEALPFAKEMLRGPSEERRFVAAKFLGQLELADTLPLLSLALNDSEVSVAARAMDSLAAMIGYGSDDDTITPPPETFDRLLRLMGRVEGKLVKLQPLVFPWERSRLQATDVGPVLVRCVPKGQAHRVLPVLDRFAPSERASLACLLVGVSDSYALLERNTKIKSINPTARAAIIQLLGDPASSVRTVAGGILGKFPLQADEAAKHEELMERLSGDIRTRALARLQTLDDASVLATSERLLTGGAPARAGALELLRLMSAENRSRDSASAIAKSFLAQASKVSADESRQIGLLLSAAEDKPEQKWTLENVFGLLDVTRRAPIAPPSLFPLFAFDAAAAKVLLELDAIVEANKMREIKPTDGSGSEPTLLGGEYFWCAPQPTDFKTPEVRRTKCVVLDLLDPWWAAQSSSEEVTVQAILRAWAWWQVAPERGWQVHNTAAALPDKHGRLRYVLGTGYLLEWLVGLRSPANAITTVLNWTEGVVARVKVDQRLADAPASATQTLEASVKRAPKKRPGLGKSESATSSDNTQIAEKWISLARIACRGHVVSAQPEDRARLWRLLRWHEQYAEDVQSARARLAKLEADDSSNWEERWELRTTLELRPTLSETLDAWAAGAATEHDFYAAALHCDDPSTYHHGFDELQNIGRPSARGRTSWPNGADVAYEALRARIVEIELGRGDAATPASRPALALRPSGGMDVVVSVLARIGRERLLRGHLGAQDSRSGVYSSLLRNAVPRVTETPDRFAEVAKSENLREDRLIDLAIYAPQWSDHAERALGWPGLAEGVWWIHAHTKDSKWNIDSEIRDGWDARIAERTPVPKDELADGAVDPEWFARVHQALGPERWDRLYDAAKYASGSGGHKRAQLYADTMLASTSEKELVDRIESKRHQDSIRALGLCPVRSGKAGTAQVLARYKLMQEFRRSSSKNGGSMLQASEKRAVEIGMENLARTAGYADPVRLQWAMETEAIADLSNGPVIVTIGDTTVSLGIDSEGTPSLTAVKKGKPLKSVPADIKKQAHVKALSERLADLRRQGSRMRQSLELAMCRGDEFSGDELAALWRHPILRPMLSRLVFVSSAGLGYPHDDAKSLQDHSGHVCNLERDVKIRIAHPHDLLASRQWHEWQSECMNTSRVQPFKQVFRELYMPTPAEKGDAVETTRYRGHQVQPRKAMALFGSRGWVARPEEGIHRTFHRERITAFVTFEEHFHTPAEIECLTLRGLSFVPVGKFEPLRIDQIPPRLFSEVLRDMDLVVSVAHAGGVDPEASQSCIEMRATLLRETARVLGLNNISVDSTRALIKGKLAEYALHLGSANVQMLPGGSVFIVAVHSQHRGRIFLPFADDDPKTAEVLSKALLLARDHEIRDPAILEQIRR